MQQISIFPPRNHRRMARVLFLIAFIDFAFKLYWIANLYKANKLIWSTLLIWHHHTHGADMQMLLFHNRFNILDQDKECSSATILFIFEGCQTINCDQSIQRPFAQSEMNKLAE